MSELNANQSENAVLPLPNSGSLDIGSIQIPWQECGEEGFRVKPLFENAAGGIKTMLMKVDSGAYAPLHAHEDIEQIYVLEGSFFDQDKTYGVGDFIIRAPGAMHSAGSVDGAVVILFYSPAL